MYGDSAVTAMRTAEMNQNYGKSNSKDVDATTDFESKILEAMRSRVTYLRNKADSFTFVSVRRMLEEYMGLEMFALDDHKTFVKVNLVKCLEEPGNGDASENFQETERNLSEENGEKNDVRDDTGVYEEMEGSAERGLMTGENKPNRVAKDMKSDIRRVLRERTSYIKANVEKITMGSLRRLLEEDLKLEKLSLDPFKKFINSELDEVLAIPAAPKRSTESSGKDLRENVKRTQSEEVSSEENFDSDAETESEGDVESEGDAETESEEVAVKKTMPRKRRLSKPEMMGKRKSENGKHVSGRKRAKHTETDSETESDAGDSEKPFKTKEIATTVYGKRVEHLKSVIKSCGMRVPPSIYKKAKQAPEEKREATLIKELEQILAKEGLSSDPSEKEIKEVKNRKTISKELEGLDTSNIVSSSRRRSTTSFAPPPKPKFTVDSDSETESDEPEDAEGSEEEEEGNEETEGSQSEEEEEEEDSNNGYDGGEESE
ncbi:PREDICTED: eukaryotic translation initiation factor 5B-like isoform X2 [Camelina sativa]|uniref:Eukaryotic translation initiation factor 5B-like isoform X2 n=1 Tax=Camelina sativa TaxID=90675 RepID=A0ABM0YFI8_CAMSA|nr:PREDICTED: eukaryotic translation initiation factor 5B-like isoform X2 [Camelina sativa]